MSEGSVSWDAFSLPDDDGGMDTDTQIWYQTTRLIHANGHLNSVDLDLVKSYRTAITKKLEELMASDWYYSCPFAEKTSGRLNLKDFFNEHTRLEKSSEELEKISKKSLAELEMEYKKNMEFLTILSEFETFRVNLRNRSNRSDSTVLLTEEYLFHQSQLHPEYKPVLSKINEFIRHPISSSSIYTRAVQKILQECPEMMDSSKRPASGLIRFRPFKRSRRVEPLSTNEIDGRETVPGEVDGR